MFSLRSYAFKTFRCLKIYKNNSHAYFPTLQNSRLYQDDSKYGNEGDEEQGSKNLSERIPSAMSTKYKIFREEDSPVILDVEEERMKHLESLSSLQEQKEDEFFGLSLQRGIKGVFDIGELVEVLRRDKVENIFVASLPPDLKYVDYIVVGTGKSVRHMVAIAEFIRKAYKRKKHPHDIIPRIEGENSKDWMALDLGNIALHIFSKNARIVYDLESLWAVGSQYDLAYNKPDDPVVALLQQHSVYLGDLQPLERISDNTNV